MKRNMRWLILSGLMASVLLGVSAFREGGSGIVAKVHAQENDEHNGGCSNASLNGAYGLYRSGTRSGDPVAAVGIATFDGNGNSTARQTTRRNGVTTSDLFTTPPTEGSYEVDPDCAGRGFNPDGSVFVHFVVVDGGKELFFTSVVPGLTATGVMKKIN